MQKISKINLDFTINSGQVFLWDKKGDKWTGVNGEDILIATQEPFGLTSSSTKINNFFREDDDLEKILTNISRDSLIRRTARRFKGLRLMRQDPFQCYISFICSSNSSIPNIKLMLQNLCKKFGTRIEFNRQYFFTFPEVKTLANASMKELLSCGLGFRAKYVRAASKDVVSGRIDFNLLRKADYKSALKSLKTVYGIGNKVADCILLFSLDKLEAFPIDRWTQKILLKYYSKIFCDITEKSLTEKKYENLHEKLLEYFGPNAGYAQQFLFKMERDINKKSWL